MAQLILILGCSVNATLLSWGKLLDSYLARTILSRASRAAVFSSVRNFLTSSNSRMGIAGVSQAVARPWYLHNTLESLCWGHFGGWCWRLTTNQTLSKTIMRDIIRLQMMMWDSEARVTENKLRCLLCCYYRI